MRAVHNRVKDGFTRTRKDLAFVDLAGHFKEDIPFWYVDGLAVDQEYITFLERER